MFLSSSVPTTSGTNAVLSLREHVNIVRRKPLHVSIPIEIRVNELRMRIFIITVSFVLAA